MGKLRPPFDAPGRLYEGRIAERVGFRADEVAAEPLQRGAERAVRVEAERLRGRLLPGAWRVALDAGGAPPASSERFAAWLERRLVDPRPIAFLIGGAGGLAEDLAAQAEERLSLGPLTMPHQLARVVLTEQLYRALCLLEGHPYPH
ncbi:MAG: rRNA (pseudouridine1915-N3)-methyltransferase [Miltoncostaeaceae bacterium]|nr:rRNA (pseudouridine1915-N3)-methyltransferase [Miltoncostaeaceae bacterium]